MRLITNEEVLAVAGGLAQAMNSAGGSPDEGNVFDFEGGSGGGGGGSGGGSSGEIQTVEISGRKMTDEEKITYDKANPSCSQTVEETQASTSCTWGVNGVTPFVNCTRTPPTLKVTTSCPKIR